MLILLHNSWHSQAVSTTVNVLIVFSIRPSAISETDLWIFWKTQLLDYMRLLKLLNLSLLFGKETKLKLMRNYTGVKYQRQCDLHSLGQAKCRECPEIGHLAQACRTTPVNSLYFKNVSDK